MRTATRQILGSFAALSLCCLVLAIHAAPLLAGELARPVSPGAAKAGALAEARCPTFSWAGVRAARGYELAVFRVPAGSTDEPVLVTRVSLSGDVRAWTPAVGQCLERGERYAWSVAAAAGSASQLDWSPALLFEVQAAPSADELERAMATIQRHLDLAGGAPVSSEAPDSQRAIDRATQGQVAASAPTGDREVARRAGRGLPSDALVSPTVGHRIASAGAAPTSGTASLVVSNQLHLADASAVFKNDTLFLWDDTSGNTALGRTALDSADAFTYGNTAIGRNALTATFSNNSEGSGYPGSYNTAVGNHALEANTTGYGSTAVGAFALRSSTGYWNTATGYQALQDNTEGDRNTAAGVFSLYNNETGNDNTAVGRAALHGNTAGSWNTAVGSLAMTFSNGSNNSAFGAWALRSNSTGSRNVGVGYRALYINATGNANTALGHKAGYGSTGSSNILINNGGFTSESHTLRIGQSTIVAASEEPFPEHALDKAFIHGILGETTGINDAVAVLIDSNGQLGTVSSSRALKQDISDVGELADRLLELRPVAFRYKQHAASDPETPLQFGLIAEEVAEVFPELVVFDADGKPETVKYHLLTSLLLGELQRQHERIAELEARSSPRVGSRE